MKHLKPLIWGTAIVNGFCFFVVVGQLVSKQVQSKTAITGRQSALVNVVKHVKSDSCWLDDSDVPFKIGDPVITPGSESGRIPTSCVRVPKVSQYLEVAYKNGELIAKRIFSDKEVRSQLSIEEQNSQ